MARPYALTHLPTHSLYAAATFADRAALYRKDRIFPPPPDPVCDCRYPSASRAVYRTCE